MSFIFENELYVLIEQYIQPEMLIVVPTLLFLGWMLKSTPRVQDWVIPYAITIVGILVGIAITSTIVDGIIQGILVSAMSVLVYNLYKQWIKKKENSNSSSD